MNVGRETAIVFVGALIAVVLQLVVAPNIALFSARPNFLLVFVLIIAIVRPMEAGAVLPFVLGLLCDLLGSGPVGGMALLFVLVSAIAARAFLVLNNDTLFMPLALLGVGTFTIEMLYAVLLIALGLGVSPVDALLYRALPCALYDCVVGLILYPIFARLLAGSAQSRKLHTSRLR